MKKFFGFRKRHSITAILFDLDLPSFATVMHNYCHFFPDNGLLIVTHWLHTYVVFVLGLICLTAVFRFLFFLFSPPVSDSLRKRTYISFAVVSFLSPRVISELHRPIGVKFCTMLLSMFDFIIPGRNFGGASPKNF